jgi:hypothetical protein
MIGMLAALPLNAGKLYDPVEDLPAANRTGAALFDFNHTASQTITDGKVEAISDRFGNGFSAAQSTADSRPTSSANGIGSLTTASFDGSDDILSAFSSMAGVLRDVSSAAAYVCSVASGSDTKSRVFLFRRPDFQPRFSLINYQSACVLEGNTNDASAIISLWAESANIISAEVDGTAGEARLRTDSGAPASTSIDTGSFVDADATDVAIGARILTAQRFQGHIADILITPSILAESDRIDYEGWQAQRGSGLASNLPATHRYRYHRPRTRTPK